MCVHLSVWAMLWGAFKVWLCFCIHAHLKRSEKECCHQSSRQQCTIIWHLSSVLGCVLFACEFHLFCWEIQILISVYSVPSWFSCVSLSRPPSERWLLVILQHASGWDRRIIRSPYPHFLLSLPRWCFSLQSPIFSLFLANSSFSFFTLAAFIHTPQRHAPLIPCRHFSRQTWIWS